MSSYNDIDITCEQCGQEFRGAIWTAVQAKEDPELKDLLMGGEINLVMCPECSYVSYQDHFILYQEPASELVAYVYPEAQKEGADDLEEMMLQGFREAQEVYEPKDRIAYQPVLVFGLEALVDILRTEENRVAQSQIAKEICKEHKIPFHVIRPSEARQRNIPRIIPYEESESNRGRASILKGLERLLKANPVIALYAELKSQMESDSQWSL